MESGDLARRRDRDARPRARPRASWPATRSPGAPTAWAWRVGTAHRRWWPRLPSSTIFPSFASPLGRVTTSRSISDSTGEDPQQERVRLPRCHRAPGRLRDGERSVLRQQRLSRRLRHDRAAGGLPRGQGRETTQRLLPELLGQRNEPFDLQFVTPDGTEVDGAFLVMVSNNPYVLGASPDVSQRRRLDTGRLGVFAVSASDGQPGGRGRSRWRWPAGDGAAATPTSSSARSSRSGRARARRTPAIDGEALELETPLRFRIHPEGLRMLVPDGNIEARCGVQARAVHVRDLVDLALTRSS